MTSSPALEGPFYPPTLGVPERFTPAQLRASLDITMSEHGAGPVWLFAYGSLIWRPEFPVAEARRARVHGYHRGLYLWSLTHRGTPEAPGLVLGLDRGGSCSGFAFRLPDDHLDANLYALWEREMPYASYRPEWLNCRLDDGTRVRALGFVLERHLPSYAGSLPDNIVQHVLDSAQGHFGTTRDYVEQTARALREYAMPDLNLEGILARCCPLRRAQE